jgi:acyl dehydratase
MVFTNQGQVYQLKVYEIPEMSRTARGTNVINVIDLDSDEEVTAVVDVDDVEDEDSVFDGLVASGWHTVALCTRMQVEGVFDDIAAMGGRGVNELQWPVPVRPGDTLRGTVGIADRRRSGHDDRADVDFRTELVTDDGDTVLSMYNLGIVRRRPAPDA